jgi:hypothetical protein
MWQYLSQIHHLLALSIYLQCKSLSQVGEHKNATDVQFNASNFDDFNIKRLYGMEEESDYWPEYFDTLSDKGLAHFTKKAQKWIWEKMNPSISECQNMKYHVIGYRRQGLGSNIHVMTSDLAYALENSYMLVYHPDAAGKIFADRGCGKGMPYSNYLCYFKQPSSCGYEYVTAMNKAPAYLGHKNEFMLPKTLINMLIKELKDYDLTEEFLRYWWRGQGAAYLIRLNKETKYALYQLRVSKDLHSGYKIGMNGERTKIDVPFPFPRGVLNAHVRHGDKKKEMDLIPWEEYVRRAEIFVSENPMFYKKIMFVSSEDEQVIQSAMQQKSLVEGPSPDSSWIFYVSHIHRINDGPFSQLRKYGKTTMVHEWLLQLLMDLECDVFFGTWGSNWNRLIHELRCIWLDKCALSYFDVGNRKDMNDYNW